MIEVSDPILYVVYVQLGKNPAPTLQKFAECLHFRFSQVQCILVTDQTERWLDFPGIVLEYERDSRTTGVKKFLSNRKEYREIANGYWLFTLERFFALKVAREVIQGGIPVVHLESDVMFYPEDSILETISKDLKNIALPRFNKEYGVGSIVYFPDFGYVTKLIQLINTELGGDEIIENDMHLLGNLLNKKLIEELPSGRMTDTEVRFDWRGYQLIFDGAAIGQYLVGQDPLHTGNRRISGYLNPDFPQNLSKENWGINSVDGKEYITYESGGEKKLVVGLHVHSKLPLNDIRQKDAMWERILGEANQIIERTISEPIPDLIHSKKISLNNRLRIARRNGFTKTLVRKLKRLFQ
jgi:hypothetical protein